MASQSHPPVIDFAGGTVELRVEPALIPAVLRAFAGTTPMDTAVDHLALPDHPAWLRAMVRFLRWYRGAIAPRLGQRCGMEPSCSHYAELALRRHGLLRGCWLSVGRLARCRPGTGGVDIP